MRRLVFVLALCGLLVGCLPIELSVSPDGRVLIPRYEGFFVLDPASGEVHRALDDRYGKPMFAVWSPDGKSFVAVSEGDAPEGEEDNGGPMAGMGDIAIDGDDMDAEALAQHMQMMMEQMMAQMGMGMGPSMNLTLVVPAKVQASHLMNTSGVTYLLWGVDENLISLTRLAGEAVEPLEENMPELVVVDVTTRQVKQLASNVSVLHRWFPDGSAVLTF